MDDRDERPTLRPAKYPELEAERAEAGMPPEEKEDRATSSATPQAETQTPEKSPIPTEFRTRKESLDRVMKFAADRNAGSERAGSYSYGGRTVSSDRIPATATRPDGYSDSTRRRISSTKMATVVQPPGDSAALRRRASSAKIPIVVSGTPAPPLSSRQRAGSIRMPPVSTAPPASESTVARDRPADAQSGVPARPEIDSDVKRRRRASSQTRLEFADPRLLKGSDPIPVGQPPGDSAETRRRARSAQISAVSPLTSVAVSDAPRDSQEMIREALKNIAHKQYDPAIRLLEKALEAEPGNEEAERWLLVCRARKLMGQGKREAAIEVYQKLIEMDKNNYEATKEIGSFHREKNLKAVPFGRYFIKSSRPPGDASGGGGKKGGR